MSFSHEIWILPDGRQYYTDTATETWNDIDQGIMHTVHTRGFSEMSPLEAKDKADALARKRISEIIEIRTKGKT